MSRDFPRGLLNKSPGITAISARCIVFLVLWITSSSNNRYSKVIGTRETHFARLPYSHTFYKDSRQPVWYGSKLGTPHDVGVKDQIRDQISSIKLCLGLTKCSTEWISRHK